MFLILAAIVVVAPAAAQDSRWYLAGTAGQSSVGRAFGPRDLGWAVDEEATSATVEVGYALSRHLGFQVGYRDLGSYAGQPVPCGTEISCPLAGDALALLAPFHPESVDFSGVTVAAVPRLPVSERFDLYGKVGVLDWEGRLDRSAFGQNLAEPSGTDFLGGVGARFALSKTLGVLLEVESSELAESVNLGATWKF
jgi:opacity protein-like surface antigen